LDSNDTNYEINGTVVNLSTNLNAALDANGNPIWSEGHTHAVFNGIQPDTNGDIILKVTAGGTSNYGALGGLQVYRNRQYSADLDYNGTVNLYDLAYMAFYWLQAGCGKPDWCGEADLNYSTNVNLADF